MSKPFCLAPWVGLYATPRGYRPCCYFSPQERNTLQEYQNSDWLKTFKAQHLSGDFDSLDDRCKMCMSDKNVSLFDELGYLKHNKVQQAYENQSGIAHLNLAFSTDCGMACKMCLISDKRFGELRQYGSQVLGQPPGTLDEMTIVKDDMVQVVKDNVESLAYVCFFGGDPSLDIRTPRVMDVLKKSTLVRYSCNGQMDRLRDGSSLVERLASFDESNLTFSIDGLGEHGKYTRKGLNEKRLNALLEKAKQHPSIRIAVCCTVSLWNVLRVTEIFSELYDTYVDENISLFLNPTTEPSYAATQNLPFKLKSMVRKKAAAYASTLEGDKARVFSEFQLQLNKMLGYPSEKSGWELFKRLEQDHELLHGYNIKQFCPEYREYL
jgi:MoaA/NifB/PqqE/SkfB family radical SAM enzyme